MQTVAIVGVGLIGGSFGLALRSAGFRGRILGVSSERTIAAAVERGAIDEGVSLETAASKADVIYLAQPISGIIRTIERLGPLVRRETLVTDAGSTKAQILQKSGETLSTCHFLGGHPMAGKESRGIEAADPDLFRGRTYLICPTSSADLDQEPTKSFLEWVTHLGARIVALSAEEHDKTVAYTSHLPQIASTALSEVLGNLPEGRLALAGPGAIDMTRLALSTFEIWSDILATNRDAVDHALSVYIDKLTEIRHNLQTQQLGENFKVAADAAIKLRGRSTNRGK
jgi:prephenate dehydrogenase